MSQSKMYSIPALSWDMAEIHERAERQPSCQRGLEKGALGGREA